MNVSDGLVGFFSVGRHLTPRLPWLNPPMPGPKPRSPDGEVGGGHTKGLHRGTEEIQSHNSKNMKVKSLFDTRHLLCLKAFTPDTFYTEQRK